MNIIVVGLGSMGKRRIRLIKKNYPNIKIFGVDTNEQRRKEVFEQYGIKTYSSLEMIDTVINAAFICTSPLSHSKIINQCLNNNINVFSEINLVDDMYNDNISLAKKNNLVLFLSSTQLYKKEIQYIYNSFSENKRINYIYHIGQYLPDWHPWESYNKFFVGDKKTNGCREILAIELPWIIKLFGKVISIRALKDKMTDLNIDYNDNYFIEIQHENNNKGIIVVDVVCRKAVRRLEVYSEDKYISWDGTPNSLFEFDINNNENKRINLYNNIDHLDGYSNFIVENAYEEEINCFINSLKNKNINQLYSFEDDLYVLSIIDRIEE